MGREIPVESSLRATDGVMACELGDGLALLHHASGTFFVLDEVGSFIWKRLVSPATTGEIAGAVQDAYDAAPEQIECDVRTFVQSMVDARLVDIVASVR